jgi:hypothetical protein
MQVWAWVAVGIAGLALAVALYRTIASRRLDRYFRHQTEASITELRVRRDLTDAIAALPIAPRLEEPAAQPVRLAARRRAS